MHKSGAWMKNRCAFFLVGLVACLNEGLAALVDLSAIPSPIVFRGNATAAFRDPAVIRHDGCFRLFFTLVRIEADGHPYSYLAWSKSGDLVRWSDPVLVTPRDRSLNYGSPGNIVRQGDDWVLCLQTYPRPGEEAYGNAASRIWTMRSRDLETWSEPELLRVKGPDVSREQMGRMIDPYLLEDKNEPGKWWCFYKQNGVSMSWSRDLKSWTYAGRTPAGENACVISDGGEYVLFHSPVNGVGVKRSVDLKEWRDERVLTLGQHAWPWAQGRLTAGFVLDLRRDPAVGKALMFFHGSDFPEKDPRGGFDNFASIGLAWSDDLKTWTWPKGATEAVGAAGAVANPLDFHYAEGQAAPRGEVRDPCIIREGDTYYLTFTMWPFRNREEKYLGEPDQGGSPGIALYASKDLKAWTFSNWLVKASELPESCPYKNRFWAPEIHKINGKFYLIFTADNWIKKEYNPAGSWGSAGYSFIGVSDSVAGPYESITWIDGGTCDMTLFGDGTNQIYAIKPKRDIYMQKLDLRGLAQGKAFFAGEEKRVVSCSNADIGVEVSPDYLEGPWVEKIGEMYYLFFAEIFRDETKPVFLGYRTSVAYADSMEGPWEKDPRGQVFFGGHLAVFDGPGERKWFSYRWEKDNRLRGRLCVDPVTIDAQGRIQACETLGGQRQ